MDIVYHSLELHELGMTPLDPFLDVQTVTQTRACKILGEILMAIEWLHDHRIIHRDIRWDNIAVPPDAPALLGDFGLAVIDDGTLRGYDGEILCAPARVVRHPGRRYIPSPADDCVAWVLLINSLLTPTRWAGMRWEETMFKGTMERERIKGLWKSLEESSVWGPGVAAANDRQYDAMLRMLDLVVLL